MLCCCIAVAAIPEKNIMRRFLLMTLAATLPLAAATPPPTQKEGSVTVTAAMRRNAIANVERYDWARARRDALLQRLQPYLKVSDEWLWSQLPSQKMPRSWYVERQEGPPPGSEENHYDAALAASRDFGIKSAYHIDPFTHPWKIQSRGSGKWYPEHDFAAFYQSALDEEGKFQPEKGDRSLLPASGGDDGRGAKVNDKTYFFAAHYAFRIWSELIDVTRDYAELYTLTNDPAYARRAALLLDRMADLYPEMDYMPHFRLGMEASTGGEGLGRVKGKIWETWTAQRLSLAYDQIFDALIADETLPAFLKTKGKEQTGRQIAAHIEENLLREFVRGIKDKRIGGNPGMHQHAMAAAAIALDAGEETTALLDWLYDPQGGQLSSILLDGLSRDGFGHECGLGYASIPTRSFFATAQLLMRYPRYQRPSLFEQFPKFRNALAAGERVRVAGGSILHWGDGGKAMLMLKNGYPMPVEMALLGFQLYGAQENRMELYHSVGGNPEKIPGDPYAAKPEKERRKAMRAVRKLVDRGLPTPESRLSSGIGFASLEAPYRAHQRMIALNYGPMGWGHGNADRLGLHLISHGAYMATDLGYPTLTGPYPPRIGWSNHTVSHNTVMVDDRVMETHSSFSGKTRLFAAAGPVRIVDVEAAGESVLRGEGHSSRSSKAKPIYPGVTTYRRCVVMVDVDEKNSYYLDLFWVRGGKSHRLIQNGGGHEVTTQHTQWQPQKKGSAAGEEIPYGHFYDGQPTWSYRGSGLMFLRNVAHARPQEPYRVEWKIAPPYNLQRDLRMRLHHLAPVSEAMLADGEAPSRGPILRYLHRTVRGEADLATQFITVLEPFEDQPIIRSCRLLGTRGDASFAAALEITLNDGRRDTLIITEDGQPFAINDGPELTGRLGWSRTAADGTLQRSLLSDASRWKLPGHEVIETSARTSGTIATLDLTDPANVTLTTEEKKLPAHLKGATLIVDNHQRADAAYRIVAVDQKIHLGPAAMEELHRDPANPSAGRIPNIAEGETFFIPHTHFFEHAP